MALKTNIHGLIENHIRGDRDLDNPKCEECNECCGINTSITKKEKVRITKFLTREENEHITIKVNEKVAAAFEGNNLDLTCPMTDPETKRCRIYNIRPETCKGYHCKKTLKSSTVDKHIKKCTHTIGDIFGFSSDDYLKLMERAMKGKWDDRNKKFRGSKRV